MIQIFLMLWPREQGHRVDAGGGSAVAVASLPVSWRKISSRLMAEGRSSLRSQPASTMARARSPRTSVAFVALDFEDGAAAALFFELDAADACDFFKTLLDGWSGEIAGAGGNFDQDGFCAARAGLQVVDGIRSDELALVDDDDLLAGLLDFGQDVGAEDDGVVAGERLDEVARLVDLLGIEAGGGLVEDQHVGVVDDGLGEADALAVALGELAEQLVFDVGDGAAVAARRRRAFRAPRRRGL